MVTFRNVVAGTPLVNWHSIQDWQIAFSRGTRGFVVMVADNTQVRARLLHVYAFMRLYMTIMKTITK